MKAVLETWRPVPGYDGLYEVSDSGVVRSHYGGKVSYLKSNKMKNGYIQVALYKNGKVKGSLVHRIEWEAFRGPIADGYEIDHINTIRDDNRLENLRVVTSKENKRNSITAERMREANRRAAKDPEWRHRQRDGAKKLSESQEWRNNQREGAKRRSENPQWRQKTRDANRARAKAVLQLDKKTEKVIRRWECIADAGRELGVASTHISKCCHGKLKSTAGFRWKFATDDD